MRNIWIIAKREYNHFFISPIAYVVAFMILLTIGIIFAINILYFIQNAFQAFGQTPDITPVTGAFGFLLVLAIPAITMRLLADEARMGTLELLLTAPVTDFELVAGKWLGGFLFILTVLAVSVLTSSTMLMVPAGAASAAQAGLTVTARSASTATAPAAAASAARSWPSTR